MIKAKFGTAVYKITALALLTLLLLGATLPVAGVAGAAGPVQATVTAAALNVRAAASTGSASIAMLHAGDQVTVIAGYPNGAWYQVTLSDGRTGWLVAAYVSLSGTTPSAPAGAPTGAPAGAPAAAAAATIVFQTSSGGAIYALNPDGTGLRYLTTGMDPAISPNGRLVAFTRWDGGSGNGALGSVWLINIDGTGERKILAGVRQPKSPTWSPDGSQIVVNMQQGGTTDTINACVPPGKRPPPGATNISTDDKGNTCYTILANPWWGLRLVNVATGAWQDLPRALHSFAPTWDPADPNLIVFMGDQGLMGLNLAANTTWQITSSTDQRTPVFSPDGTRVAVSYHQDNHWDVHVLQANGSGEVRLTDTPATVIVDQLVKGQAPVVWNNAAPTWSPTGSQIAFLTDRTGQWEIWVMNADGSGQHALYAPAPGSGIAIQYHGVDERVLSWR